MWVLFKPPRFKGKTQIINLTDEEFKEVVLSKAKAARGIDNCWFIVFYSNLSDMCLYVEFNL
jgi:hypothetical protein